MSKPPAAAPPSSDCTYLDLPASQMPTTKQGSTNVNAVKEVQCLLKKSELGIKPLAIDGQWGADTQSAMTAFQNCNNSPTVKSPGGTPPYPKLAVDGVAGPQTWADLYFWDNQYFNGTSYYCNGTR
jgi:peptidoglycan hydrolase-like protein with peptidoglycan-binding domain